MNPNSTIRPWLLACGSQFGINHAYDYRLPDEVSRPDQMYFTYRFVNMVERSVASIDLTTAPDSGYDVTRHVSKPYDVVVEIKLHNSEDGLYELAACIAALQRIPAVRALFAGKAAFRDVVNLVNDTKWDDGRIDYEHTMVLRFEEIVSIEITDINAKVDDIQLTLESDSHTWSIDENGYE